jgi:hypothetical protein
MGSAVRLSFSISATGRICTFTSPGKSRVSCCWTTEACERILKIRFSHQLFSSQAPMPRSSGGSAWNRTKLISRTSGLQPALAPYQPTDPFERMTGIEPAASCLASKVSTLEIHPRSVFIRAIGRSRTGNLPLTKRLHRQLCYEGIFSRLLGSRTLPHRFWRPSRARQRGA